MNRVRVDGRPRVRYGPTASPWRSSGRRPTAWRLLLVFLASAGAMGPWPAESASPPVEWLPAGSRFYGELQLLYAEGLLDTTVALSMQPKARVDLARWAASAERRDSSGTHPGVTRLWREFSRERLSLGLRPDDKYTPPLVSLPDQRSDDSELAEFRFTLIPYLDAAYEEGSDGDGRLADRSRVGIRLGLALGPILLYQDLFAGRYDGGRRFSDALVNDTDFLLYAEDVYATARTPWVDFSLGRTRHAWGPGPGATLLHAPEAGPMTHFSYTASLFGGKLSGRAVHADVDAAAGARLAEHGLEWVPTPALQLSLFEAARYTAPHWEPLYVASLLPFTLVQKMLEQDALGDSTQGDVRNNVIAGVGVRSRVARGAVLYGELLVDDINLEESGAPVRVWYQLGWLGARRVGCGRAFGGVEWSRVNRYVYSVYYGEDFLHQERAIGYPQGPDVRALSGRAGYDLGPDWRFALSLQKITKGEGALGESYDPNGPAASGGRLENAVDRESFGAEAAWTPRDGVDVGLRGGLSWGDGLEGTEWELRFHLLLRR